MSTKFKHKWYSANIIADKSLDYMHEYIIFSLGLLSGLIGWQAMFIKVESNLCMNKFNFVIVTKEDIDITGSFVYMWSGYY